MPVLNLLVILLKTMWDMFYLKRISPQDVEILRGDE